MKILINIHLTFITLMFSNSIFSNVHNALEENASCDRCWKNWEKSVESSIYYTNLASHRENKIAGGATSAWWEKQTQKYLEKIRQCCLNAGENSQNCNQIDSLSVKEICIAESLPSTQNIDASKDNGNSTKPVCYQSQPRWLRAWLDHLGFCHADPQPQTSNWDDCQRIKQHCIHHCSDSFLPGDSFRFDRCLRICLTEAGC